MTTSTRPSEPIATLEEYDDVLAWINDTLDVPAEVDPANKLDLADLDQQVTQLIATLEISYEDTSSQLERIIDDVSRNISRLTYDLHFMKDAATSLQPVLSELIHKSTEATPEKTDDALDQLRLLDTVKTRMEAARDVLREAESWSTLELEVTSLLSERSYAKAAERLSEANKSMVVFQNTPEYDPRRSLLVNLQNQLEASLSSALVSAIKAQDVSICREYYSIFSTISREVEFRNYYNASRRNSLLTLWQEAKLSDCDTGASIDTQNFADFLPKLYVAFTALLNQERVSIPAVFPDPAVTLSAFISSTLSALQPTMTQRLMALASHYGDLALPTLINVFQATEEFAIAVEKIMEKLKYVSLPPGDNTGKTDTSVRQARRRSTRMSISWRGGAPPGANSSAPIAITDLDWDQEVFQPFTEFQNDYGTLEHCFLERSIQEAFKDDSKDQSQSTDFARLLRERAVDVFGIAEGSLNRCNALTYGYGSLGLVKALDSAFESFMNTWTMNVQTAIVVSAPLALTSISQSDLSDMDYAPQDWSTIQTLIRLLGSAHAYEERLSNFETKLRTKLTEFSNRFRLSRNDPVNFSIAVTKGQSFLLEQSSLNTAELHNLLDSVDPDLPHNTRPGGTFQPPRILLQARKAVHDFATACQASLHQTILAPLKRYLKTYSSLPVWSQTDDPKSKRSGGASLHIPTFSLSPSDHVQRVAEGLLNLPRLFEVYADDDALSFSLNTLHFIDSETIKMISEQSEAVASSPPMHRRRASLTIVKQQPIDPEVVSSAWLYSLGKNLVNHIITDVLSHIAALSKPGSAQLSSDLEYLSNIVRALNVESKELEEWRKYLALEEEEGKLALSQALPADTILRQIGRLQGWDR
ncbi:Golgi complex component 7 (COG7) domain containing protein [Amanita muscaria]